MRRSGDAGDEIALRVPPACTDTLPNGALVDSRSNTRKPLIISRLSRLLSLVALVATIRAGKRMLQITTLSGTLPCNTHDDRAFDTIAVNGVPTVPRMSYEVKGGPLGVLPTLPENPVWLLQAATEKASAAPTALIDKIRTRYRIARLAIAITASVRARCCRCRGMSRRDSSRWSGT